jgi:hypothetical protein
MKVEIRETEDGRVVCSNKKISSAQRWMSGCVAFLFTVSCHYTAPSAGSS